MNTRSKSGFSSSSTSTSNIWNSRASSTSTTTNSSTINNTSSTIDCGDGVDGSNRPKLFVTPWLQELLNPVLRCPMGNPAVGLRNVVTLDPHVDSSASMDILERCGYRLGDKIKLHITYADTRLNWSFYFSWLDPNTPPMMAFDDAEFRPRYMEYEEFLNWNPIESPDCFKNLLHRLFADYRKYQSSLSQQSERLKADFEMLKGSDLGEDCFDVYTYKESGRRGDIVFIFPMKPEAVHNLPEVYLSPGAKEERVQLKIRYTSFGDGKSHADLELSSFYNKLFKGRKPQLPAMVSFVSEYVAEIKNILDQEISAIGESYNYRRDFILRLIGAYPKQRLINYDKLRYFSVSFLLEHLDFQFICRITLNPLHTIMAKTAVVKLKFSSIYHEGKNSTTSFVRSAVKKVQKPFTVDKSIREVNPRFNPDDLVSKVRKCIELTVQEFKTTSCQGGV